MNWIKKIVILEDEELNAERIQRLLLELRPTFEIAAVLPSVKKTLAWFAEHKEPDLLIMDIQLNDGLSFEVFTKLTIACPVIFTTAYDEYAVQAFKYNSLDYLLKPVDKNDLLAAIQKFEANNLPALELQQQQQLMEQLLTYMQPKTYRSRFLLPYRDGFKKVNVVDIAFFSTQTNVTFANLFSGEKVIVSQTLELLEQELDPAVFFRANRQYIVHVNAITKIHNYFHGKLKLDVVGYKNEEIVVSKAKATTLKKWLDF
ncbi:LytR/AlgR family response regulator transcription factor [Sphingobacterium sp. Mn56C]|uniref:LytR/AlgR family response regulator transcription factor n=1 Tax=Sphingobacterium sp. Mn56C TaxID=3395261 RepID=UPI003BDC75B5